MTNEKNKEQETAVSLFEIKDKITLLSDTSGKNNAKWEFVFFSFHFYKIWSV